MILQKETYKRFGYYPDTLKTKSNKKVIWQCSKCKNCIILSKNKVTERKTSLCKRCSSSRCGILAAQKAMENLRKKYPPVEITPIIWLMLYKHTRAGQGSITMNSCSPNRKNLGSSLSYVQGMGLLNVPKTTAIWKTDLLIFLKNQSTIYKLAVISQFISDCAHTITKNTYRWKETGEGITLWRSSTKNTRILEACGIKYECKTKSYIKITKGSFFIDGRWVHIG